MLIVRISLAFVAGGLIKNLIFMLLNLGDFWHIYQPPFPSEILVVTTQTEYGNNNLGIVARCLIKRYEMK